MMRDFLGKLGEKEKKKKERKKINKLSSSFTATFRVTLRNVCAVGRRCTIMCYKSYM